MSSSVTCNFAGQGGSLLDQALPNFFANIRQQRKPRTDSVTISTFVEMVEKQGYCYELTITLDPKNKEFKKLGLDQDIKKQWKHIKKTLLQYIDKYSYESITFPELHKNKTQVHAHGIIRFKQNNYDDMCYKRSLLMKRLRDRLGRNIRWARINLSQDMYMPSEKNYKICKKRCLKGWHTYCHKSSIRKHLGIQDLYNF